MDSQGAHTSGSSQRRRPTPLHDCACCFISVFKRLLAHIPFPIGSLIVMVDRWTHPLTQSLEHHGLCILAAVDKKVLAMGSFAEGCIFCTATRAERVLSLLYTHGIFGTSACVWLKYEGTVKEDIRKAVCLANRIPLVNYVTPAVCAVLSPLAMAVSDWVVKQAVRQLEKSSNIDTVDNRTLVEARQEVEMERPNTEMESPRVIDYVSTIDTDVGDVHSGVGKDAGVDNLIMPGRTHAGEHDFVEHSSGKDVNVGDEVHAETAVVHDSIHKDVNVGDEVHAETASVHDSIHKDDVQLADTSSADDVQLADTSSADVNVDDSARAAGKMPERPVLSSQERADSMPDVLEMIESSWHLGDRSSSSPPQAMPTSRTRSKGSKNTFKTFFFG